MHRPGQNQRMVVANAIASTTRGGVPALSVAGGILLSRAFGLIRDRVFAHYFGNSDAADAFRAAFRIPNFLQNLFGEGVLSASLEAQYGLSRISRSASNSGRIYIVECSSSRKRFPRKKYSTRLRRHKDQYGNLCYGRSGFIAY